MTRTDPCIANALLRTSVAFVMMATIFVSAAPAAHAEPRAGVETADSDATPSSLSATTPEAPSERNAAAATRDDALPAAGPPAEEPQPDGPRSPMDAAARSGFARYADALIFAENAFSFGDYDAVIRTLEPWLYPSPVLDSSAQLSTDGYAWLGASAWFNDRPEIAERFFEAGLRAHRQLTLDPLIFPPELIGFFREIRERMQLTATRENGDDQDNTVYIESRISDHPRWVSMIPFGYGMFVNGESEWGILYAFTQASLLTVSGAFFWTNYAKRTTSDDPANPLGYADPRRAEVRRRVHVGTGAAFLGVLVINMIHGAVIHGRENRIQYRTLSEPPEGLGETQSTRHSRRWNVQVGPIFQTERPSFHSSW